jgi:hypothetical protein
MRPNPQGYQAFSPQSGASAQAHAVVARGAPRPILLGSAARCLDADPLDAHYLMIGERLRTLSL